MILIFVGFFVLNLLSLAQNPVGILAPKYVKYDILGAPLIQNLPHPNFPDAYDEEPALGAQNIQMDGSGQNILFFIIDSKVYDRNGKLMGVFYSVPDYDNRVGEVLVVPAGTCRNEFFVFGTREGNTLFVSGGRPFYDKITVAYDGNGQLIQSESGLSSTGLSPLPEFNQLVPNFSASNYDHDERPLYAASKMRTDGSRFVYAYNGHKVFRLKIQNGTLTYDNYVLDLSSIESNFSNQTSLVRRQEMELITLPNGNLRMAIPIDGQTTTTTPNQKWIGYLTMDFNGSTGNYITGSHKKLFYDYTNTNNEFVQIKGAEFSADGRFLFLSHNKLPFFGNSSIDVFDLNAANPFNSRTIVSTSDLYIHSQMEIDNQGRILVPSQNHLVGIQVTPSGSSFTFPISNVLALTNYNATCPNSSNCGDIGFVRLMQDQIDDENYGDYGNYVSNLISYDVTSSTTWSPGSTGGITSGNTIYIEDNITVKAGVTLTIDNMILKFSPNARLIIENSTNQLNGGRVVLRNNSKLTVNDQCGKGMWQGVEVKGSSSQIQGVVGNTKQGSISVFGNSVIEHAITGIFAGRYLKVTNPNTGLITYFQASNGGGGIVETGTATFFNNETDIQFSPYLPSNGLSNKSRLSNTTFKTNGLLLIPTKSPLYHVDVRNIRGILIEGCDFINETPTLFALNRQGIGINSNGSSIQVKKGCLNPMTINCVQNDPNTFTNLHYGIYTSGALTSAPSLCDGSVFNQNNIGIYDRSGMNNTFTNNSFTVAKINPSNPSGITQTAGIYMLTATGYKVEGNYFTTSSTGLSLANSRTFGVVVNNSGPVANEIYRNVFENLRIGGQSENINGSLQGDLSIGLQWKCNTFRNSLLHDLTVLNGRVDFHQGYEAQLSSDNVTSMRRKAANNVFSLNNESPSLNHDILCQSMDQEIKYVYLNNASHKPDSYTLNATPNMGVSIAMQYFNQVPVIPASDGCPVKIKTIVGLNPIQWNVNIQKIGDLENAISNTNSSDASYQKLVQELSGLKHDVYSELSEMINLYANDSTSVRLDSLMEAIRTFSDDVNISKILLENHLHNNRFEEALNVLQASMLTSEEVDFYSLLIQLGTESNGFEEELSNEQKEMILETISNFTNENLRIRAQAIVADYDQTSVYSFLEASNERSQLISENEQALSAVSSQFKVYPNPSVGSFRILNTSEEKEEYVLTIKNILGQTVWTGEMNRKEKFINIESKDAGIYIVEISKKSGEITETIKIVKN